MNTYKEKEDSSELAQQKYKDRISQLEIQETPSGSLHHYEGFWHSLQFLEDIMLLQDTCCAKPSDILLSGFPESGTTWLKAISFAIATRTRFDNYSSPLLTTQPHDCVPFLESDLLSNSRFARDPELPLLATHIAYTSLPRSLIASGCKIVYIYRDPKDVFVSLFHHVSKYVPGVGLSEFFELFIKGVSMFGPFWDHVLSYWKVARTQRQEMIHFLFYENLLINTKFYVKEVKELARFMGYPFSVEEEKEGVVEKLVKLFGFDNLSDLDASKTGKYNLVGSSMVDNDIYFRQSQLGDWKNYLTPKMAEEIDKITEEKFPENGFMVTLF